MWTAEASTSAPPGQADRMWFRAHEALLEPEYCAWYPWIIPGVGYRASWLAQIIRRQRRDAEPRWELEPRVPSERHFRFQGGWRWPRL